MPMDRIVLRVSSTIPLEERSAGSGYQVGRLAGCLWLVLAAFGFLFVASAAGVGIDASFLFVPLLVLPVALALLVLARGDSPSALVVSALGGFAYAALGAWNYLRAAEFERADPGSAELSGGAVSLALVVLTLAIGLWSLGAAALATREGRRRR